MTDNTSDSGETRHCLTGDHRVEALRIRVERLPCQFSYKDLQFQIVQRAIHVHNFRPPDYAPVTGIGSQVTAVTLRGKCRARVPPGNQRTPWDGA